MDNEGILSGDDTGNRLDPDQQQVTDQLQALLCDRIMARGPIAFSDYMHACLYEAGLGYYVNGLSKIGADGDFITAPEISSSFATCIARQSAEVLQSAEFRQVAAGGNLRGEILEFGAGTGRLACDVLKSLDRFDSLPERYLILDVSGQLKAMQRQLMTEELTPRLRDKVQWIQRLPDAFNGVVLANEVFDAFPVERFTIEQGKPKRIFVDYQGGQLVAIAQSDRHLQDTVDLLQTDLQQKFGEGFTSEYCELLKPWWQSLSDVVQKGLVLICDYGCEQASYYTAGRSSGTLRCFFRHGVHNDPLCYAGVQDITADVDFTALTQGAVDAGFELDGYTPMSQFMLGNEVLQDHQQAIATQSERARIAANGKLKQLLLPQEMGERFMVAGFSRGLPQPLRGFSLADWSRLL